jgi:hypothetical protein
VSRQDRPFFFRKVLRELLDFGDGGHGTIIVTQEGEASNLSSKGSAQVSNDRTCLQFGQARNTMIDTGRTHDQPNTLVHLC